MILEEGFLAELRERPGDEATLAAYHDYLIDHGRGADAVALAESLEKKITCVADMLGHVVVAVTRTDDELHFSLANGLNCRFYHSQDCCEHVYIESVDGDLNDLVGKPLLLAEESSNRDDPPKQNYDDSYTWTYYRFATERGHVTVRFFGSSNGYYSEGVDLEVSKA